MYLILCFSLKAFISCLYYKYDIERRMVFGQEGACQ